MRKYTWKENLISVAIGLLIGSLFGGLTWYCQKKPVEAEENVIDKCYVEDVHSNVIDNSEPEKIIQEEENWISIGEFTLTAYCPCEKCCGKTDGITASGTHAEEGRTIGVDPKKIPYGTIVKINDHEYIAEDTGGAIKKNKIDIFFESHQDALKFGRQKGEVFVKEEK